MIVTHTLKELDGYYNNECWLKKVINDYALCNSFMIHKEETTHKPRDDTVLDAAGNETKVAEAEVAPTYTSAG